MRSEVIHGDCLKMLPKIEDNSIDLVCADPPYFKVAKQSWDYQWRTEEDYIEWSKKWLTEVYRSLRVGGTFYLFGYFRTLALLSPFLVDLGFKIRQQIVVDKGMRSISGRATKNYKIFPNTTESIFFLVKDNIDVSRKILKDRQKDLGITSKEINEKLGVKSNGGGMWSIYTGKNVCEQFPTKDCWEKLEKILDFQYPYEKISQTFNPQMGFTDVWSDIDFYKEKRIHPTQKPRKLMHRLIKASSNEGDMVLDPFAGSGSTLFSCIDLNRNCITIELDKEYISNIKEGLSEGMFSFAPDNFDTLVSVS